MTAGNGAEGQAPILKGQAEKHQITNSGLSDSDKREKQAYGLNPGRENWCGTNRALQLFILKKQALHTPPEILKLNSTAFKEFLLDIDIAAGNAARSFDNDIALILGDFEQIAGKLQKQATFRIIAMIEKAYYENYYSLTGTVREVLDASLKDGLNMIAFPLYNSLQDYNEVKILKAEENFANNMKNLEEDIFRKAGELFGWLGEGGIEMPPINTLSFKFNINNEVTITQLLNVARDGSLPDSILKPLMLQEIKVALPVEMTKKYQVLLADNQKYYKEAAGEFKQIMHDRLEETKNLIRSELDTAIKYSESSRENMALRISELERNIQELLQD